MGKDDSPARCSTKHGHINQTKTPRSALNPYGVASLTNPAMKFAQTYDVSVTLTLPRSPPNVERGNFMVGLQLLDADVTPQLYDAARSFANNRQGFGGTSVLFSSRRAALIPYVDPIVSLASRVLFLFWHMLFPKTQTCDLTVKLAERVWFPKRSILPKSAFIEVEAGQDIQIYEVALHLTAQLHGLRWLMFYYRLPTYIVFTFMFWAFEVAFMCIAWSFWGYSAESASDKVGKGASSSDDDDDDDDDTQGPVNPRRSFKRDPSIKEESDAQRLLAEIPAAGAEADDEDEFEQGPGPSASRRSSTGTGFGRRGQGTVRRRQSRNLEE